MKITKEVLTAMKMCRRMVYVKRTDGQVYLICSEIHVKNLDVKIEKEFPIEAFVTYDKFYATCYSITSNIQTVISSLKVEDDIFIRAVDCPINDSLMLVEIHLIVTRGKRTLDFILSVTTSQYL
jgi:hypothetical protein